MYPTAVMVLVQTQRSMVDICEISPSNTSKFTGPVASEARPETLERPPMWFNRPVHNPMMDNEAESQCSSALQRHSGPEHGLDEDILEVNAGLVSD